MKQAIDNHIEKLLKIIKGLGTFEPTPTTSRQALAETFKCDIKSEYFLYIIRTDFMDSKVILKQFRQFKDKNKESYKLSSINELDKFNGVLYVGSSASLDSRLNQHLGHTGKRVYSLQLNQWFKKITEVEIEIIPINETYFDILYPLENALWDYHRPLFGKKGTNVNSSRHT